MGRTTADARTETGAQKQILANQRFTLLELLDRLLDKGVVIKGEVLLSVADIDLAYLNLGLLLSSVKTVEQAAMSSYRQASFLAETFPAEPLPSLPSAEELSATPLLAASEPESFPEARDSANMLLPPIGRQDTVSAEPLSGPRASIDPHNVEKGLAQLVMTLIELIRRLMEQLAIRRIDAEQLNEAEIERIGNAFFLLHERMQQLKDVFGLRDEDLNLDLGPLGDLL